GYEKYDNYDPVYSKAEAAEKYRIASEKSNVPFIYLSGGVTNDQFVDTLYIASEAGADFNRCLCGRAIWKEGVDPFLKNGNYAYYEWLSEVGTENLKKVAQAVRNTATPW